MIKTKGKLDYKYLVLFFEAVVFLLLFSTTTSPIYHYPANDSIIFMMCGKLWKEGLIPYVDFFDHKGPIIFLIDRIGYGIFDNKTGIFLIQILFLFIGLVGISKIISLKYKSTVVHILSSILYLAVLSFPFEGGNLTEEYCLPFIVWSFYFIIKFIYFHDDSSEHLCRYSFFYGIAVGVALLTRLTNMLPVCVGIIVGAVLLIKNKKWKNILFNTISFMSGIIILFIPFIIYFANKHALHDFIFGTFTYNFTYAANQDGKWSVPGTLWWMRGTLIPNIFASFIATIILFSKNVKKNIKIISFLIIFLTFVEIVMAANSLPYEHYNQIYVIVIILSIITFELKSFNRSIRYLLIVMLAIAAFPVSIKGLEMIKTTYKSYNSKETLQFEEEMDECLHCINENDKVIAYNVKPYFYIYTDIKPCYKYCVLQDWQLSKSNKLSNEFSSDIKSLKADYIVEKTDGDNDLDSIINQHYSVITKTKSLKLLKKKKVMRNNPYEI